MVPLPDPGAPIEVAGGVHPAKMKLVTIFSRGAATGGLSATESTDALVAVVKPPSHLVTRPAAKQPLAKFKPALKPTFWSDYLPKIYPADRVHSLLDQITGGVRIGRSPADSQVISPNWPSAFEHRDKVSEIIRDDLEAGRLYGPFSEPPFQNFIVSPLGAFTKRNSSKIRLIHDLSFPHKKSVNDLIDKEEFSLSYSSVEDASHVCRGLGPGPVYMAKLDLENAFKHIFVDPADWHLLGFSWPDPDGCNKFYFSKVLNFGLRSSPYLFDLFASALLEFMHLRGVPRTVIRYVDDFIVIAPSAQKCQEYLDIMLQTCRDSGFSVQPSKVTVPSTVTEFLGIVIDTELQQLRISAERLTELSEELQAWLGAKKATKRKLLSLIGKLSFAAAVVRTGRAFIGRLLGASKAAQALHHHVKLNEEARADLSWWASCIASHNGVSYYNPSWSHDGVVHIFTDASNTACGGVCGREWFQVAYLGTFAKLLEHSINWREFHAVLAALATWASDLRGKTVVFHVDNMVVCHILNSLYSPVKKLMQFARSWCLLIEEYNIMAAVVYIDTVSNLDADDLSRMRTQEFLDRNPHVNRHMTWPVLDAYSLGA